MHRRKLNVLGFVIFYGDFWKYYSVIVLNYLRWYSLKNKNRTIYNILGLFVSVSFKISYDHDLKSKNLDIISNCKKSIIKKQSLLGKISEIAVESNDIITKYTFNTVND